MPQTRPTKAARCGKMPRDFRPACSFDTPQVVYFQTIAASSFENLRSQAHFLTACFRSKKIFQKNFQNEKSGERAETCCVSMTAPELSVRRFSQRKKGCCSMRNHSLPLKLVLRRRLDPALPVSHWSTDLIRLRAAG